MGGENCLQRKGEGIGEMVSAFQDDCRGFGFRMTKEELDLVNTHEIRQGKSLLAAPWLAACFTVRLEQRAQWDGGGQAHHRNHQRRGQDEPFLRRETEICARRRLRKATWGRIRRS